MITMIYTIGRSTLVVCTEACCIDVQRRQSK